MGSPGVGSSGGIGRDSGFVGGAGGHLLVISGGFRVVGLVVSVQLSSNFRPSLVHEVVVVLGVGSTGGTDGGSGFMRVQVCYVWWRRW